MIRIVVAGAESISDAPMEGAQIAIEGDKLTPERMAQDAAELVNVLYDALPQGTWLKFVAAVARQWASDAQGRISAAEWYS